MYELLKQWLGAALPASRAPRRASTLLKLEVLEDRCVPTVAAGPHGEVYATWNANNALWERTTTGAWIDLHASGVTSVSVGANGTVAAVFTDATLKEFNPATTTWSQVDTDAGMASVGPQGQLYYTRGASETLVERDSPTAGLFTFNMSGVRSLSAGADGTVDIVLQNGALEQLVGGKTAGHWNTLGVSGFSMVADGPGLTYGVWGGSNGLYALKPGGSWQSLNASGVASLSAGANGALDAVFSSDGSDWQWNPATQQWGAGALFAGANTTPAGPTLGQGAIQFGLDHLGQFTADAGLAYTCANFVAAALESAGAKTLVNFTSDGTDYVWGNLVVALHAGSPLSDINQLQPGDLIQFGGVTIVLPHNASQTYAQHTAIVYQNLGNGQVVVLEQNAPIGSPVTIATINLAGMTTGAIWAYQPVAK